LAHELVSFVGRDHFTTPAKNKKAGRSGRKQRAQRTGVPNPTTEYQAATRENRSALAMVKALKGPNNKYINTVYNAINTSPTLTNPIIVCLNAVAQGTSENTRIGRLCKNNWLDIDFEVYQAGNQNNAAPIDCRVLIVVETTALGSTISMSQFLVDNANFSPFSQRDRTNRNASRFVVLYDSKPFALGNPYRTNGTTTVVANGTCPSSRPFSMHLPLNFSTDYSRGNAGTYADIETNSLWFVVLCDDTTSDINVLGSYTTCFTDDS